MENTLSSAGPDHSNEKGGKAKSLFPCCTHLISAVTKELFYFFFKVSMQSELWPLPRSTLKFRPHFYPKKPLSLMWNTSFKLSSSSLAFISAGTTYYIHSNLIVERTASNTLAPCSCIREFFVPYVAKDNVFSYLLQRTLSRTASRNPNQHFLALRNAK